MSREAARDVCENALQHDLLVNRIEGGIWHGPAFESRRDCIWDGIDPPASYDQASVNNMQAKVFVAGADAIHDAFVITTVPLTGWWHKGHRPRI